jgi:hypothetical protein
MTSVTGSIARRIGCLTPSSSVLFVCDIQEIFRNRIYQMPSVIQGAKSLVINPSFFFFLLALIRILFLL